MTTKLLNLIVMATLALAAGSLVGCDEPAEAEAPAKQSEHHGHDHEDGHAHGAQAGELCEHDAPKELCFICDPSLRDKGRLWCKEHGRYEDRCWLCHPEIEDPDRLYCEEHWLYEDECFLCDPSRAQDAATAQAAAGPTCDVHGAPASLCFICDPSLRDKGRLWCKEHGRYEDRCWLCHPEIEDPDRAYCEEHWLYEDECMLCNPALAPQADAQADNPAGAHAHGGGGLFCHEHQVAEAECAICQPDLAQQLKPGERLKVRMPSATSGEKAGVAVGRPRAAQASASITAVAKVGYNENQLAHITPLASGVVARVLVDVGQQVEAGQVLAELRSAPVAQAKAALLKAAVELEATRITLDRMKRLSEQKITAQRQLEEAQSNFDLAQVRLTTARQQLENLGLTQQQIDSIIANRDGSSLLQVRAPFAATVVERRAVVGEAADVGDALLTLANLDTLWLEMALPAGDAARLAVGDPVRASFDALPEQTFQGRIDWVSPSLDERTRLAKVRASVVNDGGRLRNGMFGQAAVRLEQASGVVRVPADAVQTIDGRRYVFSQIEPDLFGLTKVQLSHRDDEHAYIAQGLATGDQVVMRGAFLVLSEMQKSRLGAGCAHGH